MTKIIAKLLPIYFKSELITILRANFFENLLKYTSKTRQKNTKIQSTIKSRIL